MLIVLKEDLFSVRICHGSFVPGAILVTTVVSNVRNIFADFKTELLHSQLKTHHGSGVRQFKAPVVPIQVQSTQVGIVLEY